MRKPAAVLVVLTTVILCLPSPIAASSADAGAEMVAVPAPLTRLSGLVLMKDGVTPVPGAELRLASVWDGEVHTTQSGKDGRFEVKLPIGKYSLRIERRMEVYESPSHYMIPKGSPLAMDFLLLPDFEEGQAPAATGPQRLPDPRREAERVVGSVVDMVPAPQGRRGWRWAETLGFVGTVLVIAVAAN